MVMCSNANTAQDVTASQKKSMFSNNGHAQFA